MFTKNDFINLHHLLQRATFNGLEEAEVAVVLSHKIKAVLNGSNVQGNDQSSAGGSERAGD